MRLKQKTNSKCYIRGNKLYADGKIYTIEELEHPPEQLEESNNAPTTSKILETLDNFEQQEGVDFTTSVSRKGKKFTEHEEKVSPKKGSSKNPGDKLRTDRVQDRPGSTLKEKLRNRTNSSTK